MSLSCVSTQLSDESWHSFLHHSGRPSRGCYDHKPDHFCPGHPQDLHLSPPWLQQAGAVDESHPHPHHSNACCSSRLVVGRRPGTPEQQPRSTTMALRHPGQHPGLLHLHLLHDVSEHLSGACWGDWQVQEVVAFDQLAVDTVTSFPPSSLIVRVHIQKVWVK